MAYQTYITEALVCGSRHSNTSDCAYLLFSREAGMVWASARSVREERSKQRYALQEFSHVRATLVRGKGGWRVAGVEPIRNMYFDAHDRDVRTVVRNSFRLLRRVVQGEEPHQDLFDDFVTLLGGSPLGGPVDRELLISLRVLHKLGYIAPHDAYEKYLETREDDFVVPSELEREYLTKTIAHALEKSHL